MMEHHTLAPEASLLHLSLGSVQSWRLSQSLWMQWTTSLVFEAVPGSLVEHKVGMIERAEAWPAQNFAHSPRKPAIPEAVSASTSFRAAFRQHQSTIRGAKQLEVSLQHRKVRARQAGIEG